VADVERGMLGANGIVGGGFGIAAGAALTIKTLEQEHVAVCIFGDGASNEGTFHEGLNLASILDLPVIFVCENNQYGAGTPFSYASASKTVSARAYSYDMPGVHIDGMDVPEVYNATKEASARAQAAKGPSLIECHTRRTYGQFVWD